MNFMKIKMGNQNSSTSRSSCSTSNMMPDSSHSQSQATEQHLHGIPDPVSPETSESDDVAKDRLFAIQRALNSYYFYSKPKTQDSHTQMDEEDENEKNEVKELKAIIHRKISDKDYGADDLNPVDKPSFMFVKDMGVQTGEDEARIEAEKMAKAVGKKALIYGGAAAGTAAVVGGAAFAVLNVLVPAVGFTTAGITAGSYAAGMMSSAAIANGGGVAAGGLVAMLQSIGATGVAASTCVATGAGVGAAGAGAAGAGEAIYHAVNGSAKPGDIINARYIKDKLHSVFVDQGVQVKDA